MTIIQEFKDFAVKGNSVDLAIGVVVGAAFGAITNSLVNDVINPPLGLLLGGIDFSEMSLVLRSASETSEALTLNYGLFINTLFNFIVIAFVLFLVVKGMNKLRVQMEEKRLAEDTKEAPEPPIEVRLLTEIRDLLSNEK